MVPPRKFLIATRGSPLALAQTKLIIQKLQQNPETSQHSFEILPVTQCLGDTNQTTPLYNMSQVGVFTKMVWQQTKVQQPVLEGKADFVVHSLKDLPTEEHPELALFMTGMEKRSDVIVGFDKMEDIKNILLGTSSLRRQAMLKWNFNVEVKDIRGNLETRLGKIGKGYDGIVLAQAGIERLKYTPKMLILDEKTYLHAPGQGVLGLECRKSDLECQVVLGHIQEIETSIRCRAERQFLNTLEGGCKLPIGVYSEIQGQNLLLIGQVWNVLGTETVRESYICDINDVYLGKKLAQEMLNKGADKILQAIRLKKE